MSEPTADLVARLNETIALMLKDGYIPKYAYEGIIERMEAAAARLEELLVRSRSGWRCRTCRRKAAR